MSVLDSLHQSRIDLIDIDIAIGQHGAQLIHSRRQVDWITNREALLGGRYAQFVLLLSSAYGRLLRTVSDRSLGGGETPMSQRVTPMIHVPDVSATIDWYKSIGFTVTATSDDDGRTDWATLSLGDSQIMFNAGGEPATRERRDLDLYVQTDDADELYQSFKDQVEVRQTIHDTFYGMREFTIRDINGFWITFGQPVTG